jgi:hypothetical protein
VNKTIYIRDEDTAIWDRAKELAGEKLAPVIVEGLKRFVREKEVEEAEAKGFERIEVSFYDSEAHGMPKKKAFIGKWIFPLSKPVDMTWEDRDQCDYYAVALTAKGAVVVRRWSTNSESRWDDKFLVFPSLETAAADKDINYAARKAIEAIGVPVEELDI